MPKALDVSGVRFSRLVGIKRVENRNRQTQWQFQCDCGNTIQAGLANVMKGRTTSCGCRRAEVKAVGRVTHGMTKSFGRPSEYNCWSSAKGRCYNPKNAAFADYGGRGIFMSDEWRESFENFYRDMGPRPEGTSLDRIDNSNGYEKGNCRWASKLEQANNKRNNVYFEYQEDRMTSAQLARKMNVSYKQLSAMTTNSEWTIEDAVEELLRRQEARRAYLGLRPLLLRVGRSEIEAADPGQD